MIATVVLFVALGATLAAAQDCTTTCWVDPAGSDVDNHGTSPADAFQTLAKAIATVEPGGTVEAAPGRYEPNFTEVTKSVVLRGAQAGVAVAGRDPSDTATESILRSNTGFGIVATGVTVTIDGFVFEEKTADSSIGVSAGSGLSDVGATVTVQHCIFADVHIGIASSFGTNPSSFAIRANRWDGGGTGVQMQGDRGDATLAIEENRFDDLESSAVSILVWTGATITDNVIDDMTGFSPPIQVGGCDACLVDGNTITDSGGWESITVIGSDGPSVGTTVSNNTISNPTMAGNYAIYVAIATGTIVDGNVITGSREAGIASDPASTITGNTITSAGGTGTAGILLRNPTTGTTVTGNTVSGAAVGIQIAAAAGSPDTHITRNAITGNTTGLSNAAATLADATCNWWGAANGPSGAGPGSGDAVSANVTFDPFLTSDDLENAACGAPTTTTTSTTTTVIATTTTTTTAAATSSTTTTTLPPDGPCPPAPRTGCLAPASGRATLTLKRTGSKKDALAWQWRSASAITKDAFGTPPTSTAFALCLYDSAPTPRRIFTLPAAGTCRGKPCWTSTKPGFAYKNKDATPDGLVRAVLKSGAAGKARIVVKGKGLSLALPPLPLSLPVRMQLVRTDTLACWEATYTSAKKSGPTLLKAKSTP